MLKQRVITATVLLVVLVASLCISPVAFLFLAAVAMGCTQWEWLKICGWSSGLSGLIGAVVAAGLYYLTCFSPVSTDLISNNTFMTVLTSIGTVVWTILTFIIFTKRNTGWKVPLGLGSLLSFILIPIAWFSLAWLYTSAQGGTVLMLSVLAIVWVADIGAYFVGMNVGGPKMCVGISPKKTWSGAVGAVILVILIALALSYIWPEYNFWTSWVLKDANTWTAVLLLFIVVVFSIAGDLFESALKRTAGIKDSSNLLPGHGGVYDRIDAQMPVLPLSVFILLFLQGF